MLGARKVLTRDAETGDLKSGQFLHPTEGETEAWGSGGPYLGHRARG